jgi:lysophospholipase L1-like esterase
VLDEGIDGNRILNDGWAQNALARFDRDVLAQSGVKYLIVLEGINDIGRLSHPRAPADDVSVIDLETGMKQLVDRAHTFHIKVIGATLTPYKGAGYYSEKGEAVRSALNQWIRTSGTFDGVADFDQVTRDPENPQQYLPKYDHGDHLHPSDAGYEAMGNALDLLTK